MPSVMRLSRRTLAIIGGTAGLAIAGALLWALRTPEPDPRENVYETDRPNRSDVITGAPADYGAVPKLGRSEEHTSELQSLMRISYAVFCLKKKKRLNTTTT